MLHTVVLKGAVLAALVVGGSTAVQAGGPHHYGQSAPYYSQYPVRPGCHDPAPIYPPVYSHRPRPIYVQPVYPQPIYTPPVLVPAYPSYGSGYGYGPRGGYGGSYGRRSGASFGIRTDDFSLWLSR
ncbi:MAG: hypothetical protein SFV23_04885 [Planctomycetaceae bacterium]|nr:hypothetical protein [Planctomycetaceae bacterium]